MSIIFPDSVKLAELPYLPLSERRKMPNEAGLYFCLSIENKALYIGRAVSLSKRWIQHHRCAQLEDIGGVKLAWLLTDDLPFLPALEAAMIDYFKPSLNQSQVDYKNPKGIDTSTRFQKSGKPILGKKMIVVRLSQEMDVLVRSVAGDELNDWVREAIAEKLDRELQGISA